ncbi:hypothetical protein DEU42_102332 [Flavobacterium sp. AG291]|nr:hypothetical protein DEU42_102332 [Flavobacterium sp. AG291]
MAFRSHHFNQPIFMKLIYKILSGLILSLIVTFAIAGLVSFSKLVKPEVKSQTYKVRNQHTQINVVHKKNICHHQMEQSEDNILYGM